MGFGKDSSGVIIGESRNQLLGALAQGTGIIIGTKVGILERFRMLKSEIAATVEILTSQEGTGLQLYLVDGDLTLTEFDLSIETEGPVGPNDKVAASIVERFSTLVGACEVVDSSTTELMVKDKVSNSPVCIVKPRWTFARTKSWNWILYNNGPTLTTGANVRIKVKNFGVWVT